MERSDFIDRKGERKVDFLKYYGLIESVYALDNNLTLAELRLLIYLEAIPYFTRDDFVNGTLFYTWDNRRFNKLLTNKWIVVTKQAHRRIGNHNHYNTSTKCKVLVNTIYRILCGQDELPQKYKRKGYGKNASYSERVRKNAIEAMEKSKAKDRLDDY